MKADRIQVVENGIEWTDVRETGLLREKLGVPCNVKLVGAVGSMTTRKRQQLLLQAAPLILAREPDVHFVILGDGPMRPELTQLSRTLGLEDRLHLPGVLAPATRYLGDLAAFVLPSSEEGTSNALLEAMMMGVPCVASDIPSNRQVLADGATGLLVDVTDPPALAAAILEVLQRPGATAEMVSRARTRIADRYRLDATVDVNQALYRSLASRNRGPAPVQPGNGVAAKSSIGG
jgi:glycosyltransferase involved in cell wall biosynthesis